VETQAQLPDSSLNLYRALIALRKQHPTLRHGRISVLGWTNEVLKVRINDDNAAFEVWLNFGNENVELPSGEVLCHSANSSMLGASEAILVRLN
jgi:glycosidase